MATTLGLEYRSLMVAAAYESGEGDSGTSIPMTMAAARFSTAHIVLLFAELKADVAGLSRLVTGAGFAS